jgi:dihydrofolate synthase/folylpolyglutamate synthase
VDRDPLIVLDGAHNAEGMTALMESLPELLGPERHPLVAVLSILADKDAARMLGTLLPRCERVVLTSSHNPRALSPATLESLSRQLGGPPTEIVPDPVSALARARELAGPQGAVVATGSLYLVADLLAPAAGRRASVL